MQPPPYIILVYTDVWVMYGCVVCVWHEGGGCQRHSWVTRVRRTVVCPRIMERLHEEVMLAARDGKNSKEAIITHVDPQ